MNGPPPLFSLTSGRSARISLGPGKPSGPAASPAGTNRAASGFTLVEVMVVVAIISVLATMSLPAFKRVERRAKSTAVANDLRVFAGAFEAYAHDMGGWPPDTAPGKIPPAMVGRLDLQAWTRVTPMGGLYNWENNKKQKGVRYQAALSIKGTGKVAFTIDFEQMTDLDEVIDDGDLTAGAFRAGAGNVPLYIIEE